MEDRPQPQPYGTVLTEVLNLDVAPFQKLLDQLNTAVPGKSNDVLRAYMDMKKGLASLPLYRLYLEDFRVFGDMPVEEFVIGDAQDAFAEFMMQEDIIASVIGAVFGYVCCIFVGAAQTDALQLVAVPVMAIVEAAIISIVACLLATAIPLRSIARMSIVDSIETVE